MTQIINKIKGGIMAKKLIFIEGTEDYRSKETMVNNICMAILALEITLLFWLLYLSHRQGINGLISYTWAFMRAIVDGII